MEMQIEDELITMAENTILPTGQSFSNEANAILKCLESKEIAACPGSGKTTLLLAKLYCLMQYYPLENNKGICVLSHTNVAVNEIKKRLGVKSGLLLSYPNYVGTIQSFIHRFVSFPWIMKKYGVVPSVIDNETYSQILYQSYSTGTAYNHLKSVIKHKVQQAHNRYTEEEFLSSMYFDFDDENKLKSPKAGTRAVATKTKHTYREFNRLKIQLWKKGLLSYSDSYYITKNLLSKFPEISQLISQRFAFVLIDEYQDCSKDQAYVLNQIFKNDSIVQKLGDCDQAIYSSLRDEFNIWEIPNDALPLNGSNRLTDKNAKAISVLKKDKSRLKSYNTDSSHKPVLLVYEPKNIGHVIQQFEQNIIINGLHKIPNAVFKAVGMVKTGEGLKISSYWNDYQVSDSQIRKNSCLDDYIGDIYDFASNKDLHNALSTFYLSVAHALNIVGKRDGKGRRFTVKSANNLLRSSDVDYKHVFLHVVELAFNDKKYDHWKLIRDEFINLLLLIIGDDTINITAFLTGKSENSEKKPPIQNIWKSKTQYNDKEIKIEFSTVHKVKGETHTATLYLETKTNRSTDLKRIMPLFKGAYLKTGDVYERSRRVAYVGMSRPSHLLCVAMQNSTYLGNESAFADWEVVSI